MSKKKVDKYKSEILDLYVNKFWSVIKISNKLNCGSHTIFNFLRSNNLIRKPSETKLKFNLVSKKDEIIKLYNVDKLSVVDIAKKYGCTSTPIYKLLEKNGISRRSMAIIRCGIELEDFKDDIILMYNIGHSTYEIGSKYNVYASTICNYLEKWHIPRNNFYEGKSSTMEMTLQNFLSTHIDIETNVRNIIEPKELDIFIPSKNLAIEFCGLYWHSEAQKSDKKYHYNKMNECSEKGIQLITIFEDEWLEKNIQVKSVLLSKIGIFDQRLYARKCVIEEDLDVRKFLKDNHLQGSSPNIKKSYSLLYNDEIVATLTIGKHHRQLNQYVLNRLCFKNGIQIIGGASKLVNAIADEFKPLLTWSDNRWSNGGIYNTCGFIKSGDLGPDYSYVKGQGRVSKQSQKKSNNGCPKEITEREWCIGLGLHRIWDCGKIRWILK